MRALNAPIVRSSGGRTDQHRAGLLTPFADPHPLAHHSTIRVRYSQLPDVRSVSFLVHALPLFAAVAFFYVYSMTASAPLSASSPSRAFNTADSEAVYALAQRPSKLGQQVKHALDIVDESLARYGSVISAASPPRGRGRARARGKGGPRSAHGS